MYSGADIKHEYKDMAINQIKIFGLIAVHGHSLLKDSANTDAQAFIKFIAEKVRSFLKEKFSVYVKQEVVKLVSLLADLPYHYGN